MQLSNQVKTQAESPEAQSFIESIRENYDSVMAIPGAPWIIWTSVLISLVLFAAYFAGMFRSLAVGEGEPDEHDYLGEFRKLRDQGMIDEQEYKRLTSVVPLPLPDATPDKSKNKPSSVNPAPLAGGSAGMPSGEPAKRPLTLAEAQALKKKREEEEETQAGQTGMAENQESDQASDPDQSDETTDRPNP